MPHTSLAVVILHYGDASLTRRLHGQILQSDPDFGKRVFVLDNHAPVSYPDSWLRLKENKYWAGAFQFALEDFDRAGFTHVWFLNNDLFFVSPEPHIGRAWARLAKLDARLGEVGIYAPSVTKSPYHPQMERRAGYQFREAACVDGVAPLVNLAAWKAVGGLDIQGNPHGYGVDVYFSSQVALAGWPVVVDHEVCVKHIYHSTARTVDGFLQRAALAEQAYLTKRLGSDYRQKIEDLKKSYRDHEKI